MSLLQIEGYDKFCETVSKLEAQGKDIFILFSGSKSSDGHNWCPDCEEAEPIVEEVFRALPDSAVYLEVGVGLRDDWRNPDCPFRKDDRLRLKCVPTLMHWKKSQRLEDAECKKVELISMFLEDA